MTVRRPRLPLCLAATADSFTLGGDDLGQTHHADISKMGKADSTSLPALYLAWHPVRRGGGGGGGIYTNLSTNQ